MILKMLDLGAFLLFALLGWYFLYRAVPTWGRRIALAMLHNRRDRLYKLGNESDIWEDSLIYQDMLFTLTALIQLVREGARRVSVPVVIEVLFLKSRTNGEHDWRRRRYALEMTDLFSDQEQQNALRQAWQTFRRMDLALIVFVLTSHPFLFVPAVFGAIFYGFTAFIRKVNIADSKAVEKTLEPIRMYQNGKVSGWAFGRQTT